MENPCLESITAAFNSVRIVCDNTLNPALRNLSNAVKLRHTANAKERLEEVHKVIRIGNQFSSQLEGIFNQWAKIRATYPEVKKLIQMASVPNKEVLQTYGPVKMMNYQPILKNMADTAFEYAMTNESQQMETTKGSLIGAYNAVTGYFQNVRMYKNDEAKLKSLLFGGIGQIRTQKAFNLCEEFAKGPAMDFCN